MGILGRNILLMAVGESGT